MSFDEMWTSIAILRDSAALVCLRLGLIQYQNPLGIPHFLTGCTDWVGLPG